jgi:hypothetical protein
MEFGLGLRRGIWGRETEEVVRIDNAPGDPVFVEFASGFKVDRDRGLQPANSVL